MFYRYIKDIKDVDQSLILMLNPPIYGYIDLLIDILILAMKTYVNYSFIIIPNL